MIRVDRSSAPMPPVFNQPNGKVARERAANDLLAAQQKFKEMKFTAYKDPSIMATLASLFQGKCAYCESRYVAAQPGDVEHFRPKAQVAVKDGAGVVTTKAGYYWLAAEWSNLLPSCADCNRPRQHEIRRGAGKRVLGKANWFPIDPETRRATTPAAVALEPRLLIDPCTDDPSIDLVFDEDGTIDARAVGGQRSKRGEATIEYCALARLELTQERARAGESVLFAIDQVKQAIAANDSARVTANARFLARLLASDAPYSAYASRLVDLQLGPLRAQLNL